jgi:ubiquinone/menaquinone biosynthesis C-methylase UbiE
VSKLRFDSKNCVFALLNVLKKEQYRVNAELGLNHWWNYSTKMFFLSIIKRTLPQGAHILDAGCGVGDMLRLLQKDYSVVGIDSSEDAINYCTQRVPGNKLIRGNVTVMPFESERFDGVVSLDVLYHEWVHSDSEALGEMYRLLKPGGKLFLQLPAYEWLRSTHDEWSYTSRRYTANKVDELLKASGFVNKKLGYRVCFLFPLAVIQRRILKTKHSDLKAMHPFMNTLFKLIMSFENFLALHVNFPFGLSVIGIAEKEER